MILKWSTLSSSRRYSLVTGAISALVGAVCILMTIALPSAAVGMPNAPKVFPLGLGVLLLILGIMLLVQQLLLQSREGNVQNLSQMNSALPRKEHIQGGWLQRIPEDTRNIVITIANCLLYSVLFSTLLGVYLPRMPFIGF